jgi:hypothetical protein
MDQTDVPFTFYVRLGGPVARWGRNDQVIVPSPARPARFGRGAHKRLDPVQLLRHGIRIDWA